MTIESKGFLLSLGVLNDLEASPRSGIFEIPKGEVLKSCDSPESNEVLPNLQVLSRSSKEHHEHGDLEKEVGGHPCILGCSWVWNTWLHMHLRSYCRSKILSPVYPCSNNYFFLSIVTSTIGKRKPAQKLFPLYLNDM